jgi:hypothetical protein
VARPVVVFRESLQDWSLGHIGCRKGGEVPLLSTLHPAPAAHPTGGSLIFWIWLLAVVAVGAGCGIVLSLRR